jgi:hypothetical protein
VRGSDERIARGPRVGRQQVSGYVEYQRLRQLLPPAAGRIVVAGGRGGGERAACATGTYLSIRAGL